MTDPTPNSEQRSLIETTEGVHVVDAGPGTGKSFAITRRYATIVSQEGVEPEDVLLVTFTNNAATEVKDRVVRHCEYGTAALRDAPICTFHSLCLDLVKQYGFDAPASLGIDDHVPSSVRVIDDEVIEVDRFREFLAEFVERHGEYRPFFRVLSSKTSLLGLVKRLAAKGVFPTRDGWYRDGERHLDGDFEAFAELFDEANQPNEGARGPTQSDLRRTLGRFGQGKCYLPEAPTRMELRGERGAKTVPDEFAERAFEEDRSDLVRFVHDVYFEYVEFALGRNYLNFSFLLLFAFVLLCEDHDLREEVGFEYVMIDEFQDTSEIQFKLALLVSATDNFCAVGDWKQSIYGFNYASVENITDFEERLERYAAELNDDHERVPFDDPGVETIQLRENYRSTQEIIDFSEHALTVPATEKEEIDPTAIRADVTSLNSNAAHEHSRIEAFYHEDEHGALLAKIQSIVGNSEYGVEDEEGNLRPPSYRDIAVLTRTRDFGREFQQVALSYGVPVAYEGGVELFATDQALLLLAWLRILEDEHSDRGWAVVLERAGFTLEAVREVLGSRSYPEPMLAFREVLAATEAIGAVARRVFDRYGYTGAYADALVAVLERAAADAGMNRGEVVRFVERSLEAGATHEIDDSPGTDSVTVQTIHAAKGLEHPIVIVANLNENRFPPTGGGSSVITYEEPVGLRQRKLYSEAHGQPHVYHNWRYDVCSACLPTEYDEERRLLYVAMTRAKHHLLFSAGASPSGFFEHLPINAGEVEPDVRPVDHEETTQSNLSISVPSVDRPVGRSPHSLMDEGVFSEVEEGRGMAVGTEVHLFAEAYVNGEAVEPEGRDERYVKEFIDSLDGELRVEESAYLPLEVGERNVTFSGFIDLLCVRPDEVLVVDFKTDLGRHAQAEYEKQVSVYYHVVDAWFSEREVSVGIFWTYDGRLEEVEPLGMAELVGLVEEGV